MVNDLKKKVSGSSQSESAHNISYFSLYRFASNWDKVLIAVGVTATFLAGMTLPYAITLVANVFQSMIDYTKSNKHTANSDKDFLKAMHHFGVNYSLIGVVLFVGGYLGTALMNVTAINQIFKIREAYLRAALNQDFTYFDLHHTGDFASKMAEDVMKLEEGIGDKVSTLVYNLSIGVSSVTMALFKGWKLALLCLIATPLTLILVGLTGMLANKWYKKQSHVKGLASAVAEEAIGSIKTVYAFNGQQKEIERYKKYLTEVTKITVKKELFTGLSMGCLFFCVFASYALSFYFGIYLVVNEPENYNADVMFSVFFGIMTAMGSFGMLGTLMTPFGQACGAGAQVFRLIDNVPKINPLLNRGNIPLKMEGNIELRNVLFHYPSRPEIAVIKGVSLSVKRGQSVALVGHSGSGKSTIIHLLSRYYDVDEGSVSIDGNDVSELSVRWLRAQIGLVGQEPVLFNATVRENIRYGYEGASDFDIEDAAKQANVHDFIIKLPAGYDTIVGQRGEFFSGGQKQRIAIARALVRNPTILLLDEATSALDVFSESQVKAALDKASKGRTTVIVAHRLSTIRNVDVIHVMKEGEIVESGSHGELVKKKGHYYDMLEVQEPSEFREIKVERIPIQEEPKIYECKNTESTVFKEKFEEDKSKVPSLTFRQVLALNAPEWKYITVGSVSATINGFSMPAFIVIFGNLFGSMTNPDTTKLMNKVQNISIMCLSIGLLLGISNFIETVSFGVAGTRLTERLRLRMFTHILQQDAAFFEERANTTGALCARLSADAAQVQGATGQRIGIVLQSIGSVGLALLLGIVFEWRVGMVILAFVPLIALVVYKQGKATDKESSGYFKAIENSTKIAIEAVSNVRTVASLGLEQKVVSQYMDQLRPALKPCTHNAYCRGVLNALSRSMFNFINAAALTYGGHLIVSSGVAPEDILVTTQALQMASTQAQNAFTFAPDFHKGINAASRIVHFLASRPKIIDPEEPTSFTRKGEACLKNVKFNYPTRPTVHVFDGLTMEIPQGKTVAVVGQSGCGKSTIIQLLERYYDPHSGVISLDNIPLAQLRLSDIRSSFGLVSQEPVLFDRSIRENIAYGDNSRYLSDEEIYAASTQANIHNFIISLPRGYDTDIGSKGVQLSGGQKQRVAIARALVRRPKILLLDEATSALDTENEKVVQEALELAKAGRTCVVIAHRLSTVRDADVICVLSAGRVAERGTHHALMQLHGLYYNLCTKQH